MNKFFKMQYWSDLKIKFKKDGSKLYDNLVQLKLQSEEIKCVLM